MNNVYLNSLGIKKGYDLKSDFKDLPKSRTNNAIVHFMEYRLHNIKQKRMNKNIIDCDKADIQQTSGKLYVSLWLENDDALKTVDGDLINSFWTIFRNTLELTFKRYYCKSEHEYTTKEIAFKYQFVLLFGGLSQKNYPICNIKEKYKVKEYFKVNYKYLTFPNLNQYIETLLTNKKASDKLKEERYQWIIDNIEMIESIILRINGSRFLGELKRFAALTHNIGNLIIFPKGYNYGRYNKTGDFFDLTLETIYNTLGTTIFKEYANRYFLNIYLENGKPKKFWEDHLLNKVKPKNLEHISTCLERINTYIETREDEILEYINSTKKI